MKGNKPYNNEIIHGFTCEIREAHDRYANMGIGYILQKAESNEGVTILAVNQNKMDESLLRRMHYIIDFPSPEED